MTSRIPEYFFFFFFNDTATTEIYTLSLHDALPICTHRQMPYQAIRRLITAPVYRAMGTNGTAGRWPAIVDAATWERVQRSEEHTSELQSRQYLVCRLLLEKKNRILLSAPARSLRTL